MLAQGTFLAGCPGWFPGPKQKTAIGQEACLRDGRHMSAAQTMHDRS